MDAGTSRRRIHNEINITPLTDVFLVLLIIMMLLQTSATLRYAGQIRPPQVQGAERLKQADRNCILELTGKGPNGEAEKFSLDKTEMALPHADGDKQAVVDALKNKARGEEKEKLLLRSDKDASSEAVLDVVDAIQAAAADETLSTSQRNFLSQVTISVETMGGGAAMPKQEEASKDSAGAAP